VIGIWRTLRPTVRVARNVAAVARCHHIPGGWHVACVAAHDLTLALRVHSVREHIAAAEDRMHARDGRCHHVAYVVRVVQLLVGTEDGLQLLLRMDPLGVARVGALCRRPRNFLGQLARRRRHHRATGDLVVVRTVGAAEKLVLAWIVARVAALDGQLGWHALAHFVGPGRDAALQPD